MVPQRDLMISALFFAAFWTLAMILINAPDAVGAIVFTAAGALAGVFWYFGMRWWRKGFRSSGNNAGSTPRGRGHFGNRA